MPEPLVTAILQAVIVVVGISFAEALRRRHDAWSEVRCAAHRLAFLAPELEKSLRAGVIDTEAVDEVMELILVLVVAPIVSIKGARIRNSAMQLLDRVHEAITVRDPDNVPDLSAHRIRGMALLPFGFWHTKD